MILKYFYNIVFILCFSIGLGAIKPISKNEKDVLVIEKIKKRPYYSSSKSSIVYEIEGPMAIRIISRSRVQSNRAYNKKTFAVGYDVILDNKKVDENYYINKIDSKVASENFSGYSYSKSNSFLLSIPDGKHRIKIKPHEENYYPLCLRLIKQDLDLSEENKKGKLIHPNEVLDTYMIIKNNYSIKEYYKLTNENNIQLAVKGPKMLKIISRLEMENRESQDYNFIIDKNGNFQGKYAFTAEPSSSKLKNEPQNIIGKWRACRLFIPDGRHFVTLKNPDEESSVFVKFLVYE